MLNLSRLGAVRCLFFLKSEQYSLIDMPVQVGASVDKHGHIKAAHTRIQKVRVERAAPVQASLFGGDEPAQKDKRPARLDAFIRKHGGIAQLAHLMAGMTEGQQQRIFEEMGRLGGKTVAEISAMFDHVKPEAPAQADMFAQPATAKESSVVAPSPDQVTKLRDLRESLRDMIATKNSRNEPIPQAWLDKLAEADAVLGLEVVPEKVDKKPVDMTGWTGPQVVAHELMMEYRRRKVEFMTDKVALGQFKIKLRREARQIPEDDQKAVFRIDSITNQIWPDYDPKIADIEYKRAESEPASVQAAPDPELVEHVTGRGKTLRGIIRTDLSKDQATEIDPYTFKKDGGYFIREKHLTKQKTVADGRVTADSLPVQNTTIRDGKGNLYRVHSSRHSLVIAHPIVSGRAQVNADSTVRFWVNPDSTPSGENDRTDPVYVSEQQADMDPKEGDRKIENGVEYVLRDGRWHSEKQDEAPKIKPVIAENPQITAANKPEEQNTEPFGVSAGITKAARVSLNNQARTIVSRGAPFSDEDKAILRQYSGNGGCGDSLNEFYTLPEVAGAMWSVAQRLGVTGDVLEQSCGPGVFLHTAPGNTKVVGVEWDETSAKIAKALHGDRHEIQNASLERFSTQDSRQFDGVLGNVPFGLRGALIKDDKPKLKTADAYFFDTAMDKCKAGGVVGLIVPTGIMDSRTNRKLREALMRKGQFLGAQRMPNTAFEHSHTGVTTDVVWFRKFPDDVAGALSSSAIKQDSLKHLGIWDDEFLSGNYFTGRGAANVLGTMGEGWRAKAGMGSDITVEGSMQGVPEALREFQPEEEKPVPEVKSILESVSDDKARAIVLGGAMTRPYADKSKVGDTKTVDGVAYVLQGSPARWHRIDEVLQSEALTQGQEIAERIDALMAGMTAVDRPALESDLRAWVEAHGIPAKNKDILLGAQQDKTLYRLIGAVKSNGELSDAVLGKVSEPVVGNFEATVQSMLRDRETIAAGKLAQSAGIDEEDALDQLYGSPKYAIDAATGEWTSRDIFLSGDLWAKFDATKAALSGDSLPTELRKKLEQQEKLLTETIDPVSIEDTFIQVNSAFLPTSMLSAFLTWKNRDSPYASKWTKDLDPAEVTFSDGVYTLTGGNQYGMMKDLDKYLNRTGLRKEDKHVIDDLNVEFKDWLCASAEYREMAEDLYNRKFRGFAEREFSNEPMDIPGMNTEGLKDYQWGGLRWALNAGKGIIAADVGLGKTARALMLARTLKTTGQAKRPMIVVPKSVLANWYAECEKWFPGSKVLTIGGSFERLADGSLKGKDDNAAERKRKYHDLQQNDYDFIICSEPSFEEIDLDPQTKDEYNSKDFWVQRGVTLGNAGEKRSKAIREAWEQARAGQEFSEGDRTDATYFNGLGVDALICDEFHHCFPAGTLVDGVPIESLKAGDFVKSFNHKTNEVEYKQVLAVAAMPAKPLARVTLSTGQQIVSTFDHRFFTTEFGYVEARYLNGFCSVILNTTKTTNKDSNGRNLQGVRGDFYHDAKPETASEERRRSGVRENVPIREARAGCDENMLSVRRRVHAEQGSTVEVEERESGSVLLHQELFCAMASGAAGVAGLAESAGNKEEEKRGAKGVQLASGAGLKGSKNGSASNARPDESERATGTRRERDARICSATDACRCAVVGDGVLCKNRKVKDIGLSAPLHDRHCESGDENCNRGKREQPQWSGQKVDRSEEGAISGIARVVSVAILEPGSDGEFERLCSNGLVYDIEVDGNHNFFAEGVLVHNCKNLCGIKSRFGESPKFLGGGGQSMRALDFNLKARWLLDNQNGKNVYGLTATPTKNSPIEIYAMLSHVAPEAFEKIGVRNSEEFLDRFARFEDGMALTTSGQMEDALITKGFQNMDELRTIMKRYIHRQTAEEVGLQLPQRQDVTHMVDMDDAQQAKYSELRELAEESGEKDATGDSHIFSIMDKMNKAAVDLSLVDSSYDGTKSPKYASCAQEVIKGVKDGGQIVFTDYVDSHEKIAAALVKSGIPRNQIGVINAKVASSSAKRQSICDQFNAGKLKVVIGNTATMGEGLNLQKGTSDIHHLDLPWEPASMQQRNGRGLRQGNSNKGVRIHSYLAKGSFDGYRLQSILAKKDWQDMVWTGGNEVENLNNKASISRDEMMIMLSADPDQAREAFEANHKAKEERLIAGKTAEASQRFVRFQEVKRSYASIKDKGSRSAAQLKSKLDKEYAGLKHDKYFTVKQALDMETPVIVSDSGALLHAGAGIDIREDDKPARYVVTHVDQRKRQVTMRRYGDGSTQLYTRDVKDLPSPKTFAYDEKVETEAVAKELAERPMVIKNLSEVMKVPSAVIAANHDALQKQLWDGAKSYKISLGNDKVALIEKATGKPVIVPHYDISLGKGGVSQETHDFLLPTEENKKKAVDGWMDAERASTFGTDYTQARRGGKTTTIAKRKYGSLEHGNPWRRTVEEMSGQNISGYYGGLDSPPIKSARAQLVKEQMERIKHADTFADALDAAAPLGEIIDSAQGHSAHVSLPKRVVATLWAKARQKGVLDEGVDNHSPKKTSHGYTSNKHGSYFTRNHRGSIHSMLLHMGTGHDDLVHAMVESGIRHGKVTKHDEAFQALAQGFGHSENRILAIQKLAELSGIAEKTRGQLGSGYGTIGSSSQWDTNRDRTVREELAMRLNEVRARDERKAAAL